MRRREPDLGQIVWPDYGSYPNIETAFIDVTRRVGGWVLFQAMALMLVAENAGAGQTPKWAPRADGHKRTVLGDMILPVLGFLF